MNENYPHGGLPDKDARLFFDFMESAMTTGTAEESAVDDFAAHLLKILDYDEPGNIVRQQMDIHLFMSGSKVHAKADVCVISQNPNSIRLVQEDKRHRAEVNPEAQLIAEAIASFQSNNRQLSRLGQPILIQRTVPGIVLIGTTPTFYKIGVTTALIDAIETASYPSDESIVHKLIPPVPRPELLRSGGMKPLDNRAFLLGCFEAFKKFI